MSSFHFLKSMWPPFRSGKIDNGVFKMHYRYTVSILLVFSFVITCRLAFGNSFSCQSFDDFGPITPYCYSHSPYIVEQALSKRVGIETPYPGISFQRSSDDQIKYVPFYPWVNLFFLILAFFSYLPHLVWKALEGGLMTRLTSKVNDTTVNESERKASIIEIAKYIIITRGGHLGYTGAYLLSEVLNFLVSIVLISLLVSFFNVSFSSSQYFEIDTWDQFYQYNFPMASQCDFYRYGPSGDVQKHDIVCFLYLNKLYGYMFLFLFAWFIMMCIMAALVLPYRFLCLVLPPIRLLLFRLRTGLTDQALLNFVNTRFSLGDWFLLTRLQKNLLPHDFTKLLIFVQENYNKSSFDMEMSDLGKMN